MDVTLNRRAEIAFRSLSSHEQARISRILGRIRGVGDDEWQHVSRARKLDVPGGLDLFAIRAGEQLRLVAAPSSGSLVIEDIVPVERLSLVSRSRLQ